MVQTASVSVLFVCLGNICRSPQAEGIFRHMTRELGLSNRVLSDSAGTAAYHQGEAPDSRTRATSARRGVPLQHAARPFHVRDFDQFDHILAMDQHNFADLLAQARTAEDRNKVRMLRSLDPHADDPSVPDPYYGGAQGFDHVFDVCWNGCEPLLRELCALHDWPYRPISPK